MDKKLFLFLYFVVMLIMTITMLSACSCDTSPTPSPISYFPTQDKFHDSYPTADFYGTLTLENGTLRLASMYSSVLLIWPHGFTYRVNDGLIQVLDQENRLVASVGDTLYVSGGEVHEVTVNEYASPPLPQDCPGPYWLIGFDISTVPFLPPTPLRTVAPPNTTFYDMPDSGIIDIEGHSFYYQRIYLAFERPAIFHDVIFDDIDTGTVTYTGGYRPYSVTFKDGTQEDIIFAGTLISPSWYILSRHTNPQAGIIIEQDHDWVKYALVSVD